MRNDSEETRYVGCIIIERPGAAASALFCKLYGCVLKYICGGVLQARGSQQSKRLDMAAAACEII